MQDDDGEVLQQLRYKEYETIRIRTQPDGLDILTLAQPPMNPLSAKMFLELGHYFCRLRTDLSVRVVILRSEGKAFCAGLDLKEHQSIGGTSDIPSDNSILQLQRRVSDLVRCMRARVAMPPLKSWFGRLRDGVDK